MESFEVMQLPFRTVNYVSGCDPPITTNLGGVEWPETPLDSLKCDLELSEYEAFAAWHKLGEEEREASRLAFRQRSEELCGALSRTYAALDDGIPDLNARLLRFVGSLVRSPPTPPVPHGRTRLPTFPRVSVSLPSLTKPASSPSLVPA